MKELIEESFGIIPMIASCANLKFLLIKAPNTNEWTFPKGHAEPNETPIDAARRELREETGIKGVDLIPNLSFTDQYQYEERGSIKVKKVTFFAGYVSDTSVTIQAEEVGDYRWATYDEALKSLSFKSDRDMLKGVGVRVFDIEKQ